MKKVFTVVMLLLISNYNLKAQQAGDFDSTFNFDGIVTTDIGRGLDAANAVIVQPDGKIIIGGYAFNGNNIDFALVRLNTNGTLDYSFGTNGKVLTDFIGGDDIIYSLELQNDGKIIAAGSYAYTDMSYGFALARYNSNGLLDVNFGTNGITYIYGGAWSSLYSVKIENDGKIIAGGMINSQNGYEFFVLVNYKTNGTLDSSFGFNGIISTLVGSANGNGQINSIALQSDGKIVALGDFTTGSYSNFALARYFPNGNLDSSFNNDGLVETNYNGGWDFGQSICIQPDGKIIAGGYSGLDFVVYRYNSNGTLDNSFSSDGKQMISVDVNSDLAYSMVLLPDGKIILGGIANHNSSFSRDFALIRLLPNGTIDNSFGINGRVITDFGVGIYSYGAETANAIALQTDGKIIAVGFSTIESTYGSGNRDFALARYDSTGILDSSFSEDGIIISNISTANDDATCLSICLDGKIIASGFSGYIDYSDFAVAKYNLNGSPDSSFSLDGNVEIGISYNDDQVLASSVQPDGKIIVAGKSKYDDGTFNYKYNFSLARFDTHGILDNEFHSQGFLHANVSNAWSNNWASSVLTQPDGKIIAAGYAYITGFYKDFALVRYEANGNIDSAFGNNGITTSNLTGFDFGNSLAQQSDGKIILAGSTGVYDFALARYNTNGTLDNSFSSDGVLATDFPSDDDEINSVIIQPDGKIIVGGITGTYTNHDFGLARYNSDGTLDNTFGVNGKVITSIGSVDDVLKSIVLQPDGKIVGAGYTNNGIDNDFVIVRYNSNGKLDSSFSSDGILNFPIGQGDDKASAVGIDPDGKIIVSGTSFNGINNDFALVRLQSGLIIHQIFATICPNEIFSYNGNNYSIAGNYFITLTAQNGSDSIVGLTLNVIQINTSIINSGDSLIALTSGTVQWFNCATQQIIPGANGNVFVPSSIGNYAAIITEGNCTITSQCINTSVNAEFSQMKSFTIYPNPTDENITISLSQPCNNCRIEIINTLGQIVYEEQTNSQLSIINCQLLPAGIYFVELLFDKMTAVKKLVKQ